jgi:hypothetical protein
VDRAMTTGRECGGSCEGWRTEETRQQARKGSKEIRKHGNEGPALVKTMAAQTSKSADREPLNAAENLRRTIFDDGAVPPPRARLCRRHYPRIPGACSA